MGKVFWKIINRGFAEYPLEAQYVGGPVGNPWFYVKDNYEGSAIIKIAGKSIVTLPHSLTLRGTALRMLAKNYVERISAYELLRFSQEAIAAGDEAEQLILEAAERGDRIQGLNTVETGSRLFADGEEPLPRPPIVESAPPPENTQARYERLFREMGFNSADNQFRLASEPPPENSRYKRYFRALGYTTGDEE